MKASILALICVAIVGVGYALPACVGDDTPTAEAPGTDGDGGEAGMLPPSGKDLGAACTAGSDCASANCADGVCCDSACTGTCEKCTLAGSVGKCLPVAEGEDPDKECPTTPLPPPVDSDAGSGDAAAVDASAEPFVVPDSGVTSDDNQCKGTCNGKRACAYPGADRTCGSVYCGNTTEQGRAACDSKGHCVFGVEECSVYSCADGSPGCKKSCAAETDCLAGYFRESTTNTCKPKLADGTKCASVVECKSGNCENTVCCNSVCNAAGSACNSAGNVGKCVCPACVGGTCALFYMDEDGDTYGDVNGTVANGRAAYGCVGAPPPNFVDNKLDCYDGPTSTVAGSVHPGQTIFFTDPYTPPGGAATYDYDCNGTELKETLEFSNTIGCGFCNAAGGMLVGCNFETTCKTVAHQPAGLHCQGQLSANACTINATNIGHGPATTTGFTSVVPCGGSATKYSCGSCDTLNGTDVHQSSAPNTPQRCR